MWLTSTAGRYVASSVGPEEPVGSAIESAVKHLHLPPPLLLLCPKEVNAFTDGYLYRRHGMCDTILVHTSVACQL